MVLDFSTRWNSSNSDPEPVSALISAKFDFVNIALIDRKNFADSGPTGTINKKTSAFCQHGAGKEKIAAGATLTAGPLAENELLEHIFLAKLNKIPPPEFADRVDHRTRLLDYPCEKGDLLLDKNR
jgi:hypothetical protein